MGELSHRYAVVLAADVARFSQLIERDDESTVRALQRCRVEFQRCLSSFHGREFGSIGDSLMAEFNSPVEALRAALDCQQRMADLSPMDDTGSKLMLKIGLHAGDTIRDGEALYGEVVNIAARLQALARPGEIVLSDFVYQQVRNQRGLEFRSIGKRHLKNISEPFFVYRVHGGAKFSLRRIVLALEEYKPTIAATLGVIVAGALLTWHLDTRHVPGISDTTITLQTDNTIAVLPFDVCDEHSDDELVANGLTTAVHDRLAQRRPILATKSQASVKRVVETMPPFTETSRLLGVENLLRGEVCRDQSGRLTIDVELLDKNGFTKWHQDYQQVVDRDDLVQAQVARLIETGVVIELGNPSLSVPDVPVDRRALEQLLIAREHRRTGLHDEARDALVKALEIEPDFTEAYIELALLTISSANNRIMLDDAFQKAIEISSRVLTFGQTVSVLACA